MNSCIEFDGCRTKRGYGRKYVGERKRTENAHRVVMAEIHGWEALEGMVVMHLCDNPPCVNPDHLRIASQSENMSDWSEKFDNAAKTHCPQGHRYDEQNTYLFRNGRKCRACHRDRANRTYRQRTTP